MHNLLIVDNNVTEANLLKCRILEIYTDWIIQIANNYQSAYELLQDSLLNGEPFTLFLFEIQLSTDLSDRSGFLLAKELRSYAIYYRTPLIFLTAIANEEIYALSNFHCYNYILKPYSIDTILSQIAQMLHTGYLEKYLELTDIYRVHHKLAFQDIQMAESNSHTIILHSSTCKYITREYTLEKLLLTLGSDFIQCHRKYIINKNLIKNYDKVSQQIQVGTFLVPVGRKYSSNII